MNRGCSIPAICCTKPDTSRFFPSERRTAITGEAGDDAGYEMAAIAWSYAAALHIGLDPAIVFHPTGYRGSSQAIMENFAAGRYIGVPILEWLGLTISQPGNEAQGVTPYPHMLKWLVG